MDKTASVLATALLVSGCAIASPVMDAGNGTFLISAHASAVRGGATGASTVAYDDAQKYCVMKAAGHAVVITEGERDVYQSSFGATVGPNGGSAGGGTFAAGNSTLHFRCDK